MFFRLAEYNLNTILLYISLVVIATLLACLSQSGIKIEQQSGSTYRINYILWFILSFLLLSFFAVFNNVGTDKVAYKLHFDMSAHGNIYSGYEIGFQLFIGIIKLFTSNSQVFVCIISFLTVSFYYIGIWKSRNYISLGLGVFIYSSQFYFQQYNLMRMYFAASIVFAFWDLFYKRKYLKFAIVIMIASTIHYSMLFSLAALIIARLLYERCSSRYGTGNKLILLSLIAFIFSFFGYDFLAYLTRFNIPVIAKYAMYISNSGGFEFGFKWIFNIFPYILLFGLSQYDQNKKEMYSVHGGYFIVVLAISIMSYRVEMIGRALSTFSIPMIILLPKLLEDCRKTIITHRQKINIYLLNFCVSISCKLILMAVIMYMIFSFYLYLSSYLYLDGIDNFHFIWS